MNKNIIIVVIVILIVATLAIAGYMYYQSQQFDDSLLDRGLTPPDTSEKLNNANNNENLSTEDTTDAIDTDLDNIDIGDLDAEFQDIDADMETL